MSFSLQRNILDRSGLFLLALLVSLYSIFGVYFAEWNVEFPFLGFPVFIGEIALAIGLVLAGVRIVMFSRVPPKTLWLLGAYLLWIIVKAVEGYFISGAYSLRNAALFYYPLFALLIYIFFDTPLFLESHDRASRRVFLLILFGILACFLLATGSFFLQYYLLVLMVLCIRGIRGWWRGGVILVAGMIAWCSHSFHCGVRTQLVSLIAAGMFIVFMVAGLMSWPRWIRISGGLLIATGLFISIIKISDPNAVASLVTPKEVMALYKEQQGKIDSQKGTFIPKNLPIKPYAAEPEASFLKETSFGRTDVAPIVRMSGQEIPEGGSQSDRLPIKESVQSSPITALKEPVVTPQEKTSTQGFSIPATYSLPPRPLGTAYVNILFRYFVWRDMVNEFIRERPSFGFSFGHPQRSRSLEILGWAQSEWLGVGWVTPHNSFLHLIYRGGVIGLGIIALILVLFILMARDFFRLRSLGGILALSVILFGLVSANFLVFLELPYTAIPFWCVFGAVLAYGHHRKGCYVF